MEQKKIKQKGKEKEIEIESERMEEKNKSRDIKTTKTWSRGDLNCQKNKKRMEEMKGVN